MSEPLKLTGMVLSAAPAGEYDKRVVILTKERGKLAAFARGAEGRQASSLPPAIPFLSGASFCMREEIPIRWFRPIFPIIFLS